MAAEPAVSQDARALLVMVALAAAFFGWHLGDDKPRVHAGLGYLLALVLCACLRAGARRLMALVCTFGIAANAAGLSCVVWYRALSSKEVGVCDEGTGLPVGLFFGVALLMVAAEFLRGGRDDGH